MFMCMQHPGFGPSCTRLLCGYRPENKVARLGQQLVLGHRERHRRLTLCPAAAERARR